MNIKILSGNDRYRLVITAKGKDHWRIDYMTLGMKYDEFKQEGIKAISFTNLLAQMQNK